MDQETFKKLSKTEQRRAICQDVIDRLTAKKLRVQAETAYISSHGKAVLKGKEFSECLGEKQLNRIGRQCTACALGGMMLSRVSLANEVKGEDIAVTETCHSSVAGQVELDRAVIEDNLSAYFDEFQITLIEAAFETGYVTYKGYDFDSQERRLKKAVQFGEEHKNDSDRLLAIMQNIVDNPRALFNPDHSYEIVRG